MSIDIKDHRRYLERKLIDTDKLDAKQSAPLLQQIEIAKETGDNHLDKMLRALAAKDEEADKHATSVALKGIGCVQDDMLKLQQFEYFYTKGKLDAYADAATIPEKIMLEERGHAYVKGPTIIQ